MEYIYGALLLHKLGHPVTEENLKKVIHATGSQVDESKLKALIACFTCCTRCTCKGREERRETF